MPPPGYSISSLAQQASINGILLTNDAEEISDEFSPDRFIDGWAYSHLIYLQTGDEDPALNARDGSASRFVHRQPQELVNYISKQEKPCTEILTAD